MRSGFTHKSSRMINETTGTVFTSFMGGIMIAAARSLKRHKTASRHPITRAAANPVAMCNRLLRSMVPNRSDFTSSANAFSTRPGRGSKTDWSSLSAAYCHSRIHAAIEISRYAGFLSARRTRRAPRSSFFRLSTESPTACPLSCSSAAFCGRTRESPRKAALVSASVYHIFRGLYTDFSEAREADRKGFFAEPEADCGGFSGGVGTRTKHGKSPPAFFKKYC